MQIFRQYGKLFAALTMTFFLGMTTLPLQAAMVDNDQLISQAQQSLTKQEVLGQLDRQDVQDKLVSLGVDMDDAKERINQMTDEELNQLAQNFDEMPTGSGILGAILVVFIVLVITDMLGATDVFSFVNNINR